jgi:transposase-like protein
MSNELVISDELYAQLSRKGAIKAEKLGRNYTAEEKIQVCTYWLVGHSSRDVAAMVDIPSATIRDWMTKPWWKELIRELRRAKGDELDNDLTRIIHKATRSLEERIENGNFKVNPKTGEMERVPLSATELATAGIGIPFDKRALGRGDPTSKVSHEDNSDKLLERLAEQFVRITKMQEPTPIEGEVIKE